LRTPLTKSENLAAKIRNNLSFLPSTGEAIEDRCILMRVKSALSNDDEYKYDGVDGKIFKGKVQLSGFVDTRAQ
jgi:osmotically-inducible protein OsmY